MSSAKYIVMDFIKGATLATCLSSRRFIESIGTTLSSTCQLPIAANTIPAIQSDFERLRISWMILYQIKKIAGGKQASLQKISSTLVPVSERGNMKDNMYYLVWQWLFCLEGHEKQEPSDHSA
ncbi:hypothetical protein CISG_06884 [Coccidioides immitis RMSCC 3703]|uniref:Uncharacterized protein n=1 Tax=Coccidioides immitis RMSCC 3703 TaxID=454286 RepID=A0A0J8QYJ8_COCIT|nr:hypothetical protein CISG_06884 [Coccidioides immitis RMSCC 3703]